MSLAMVVLLVLVTIAFCDLLFRRVPNWLVIAGLIALAGGLAFGEISWLTGFSASWNTSLIGLFSALLIFVPLWKFGAMGAGDVKFLGLLGFFFGLPGWFAAWVVGSVLVGLHVVLVMLMRHSTVFTWMALNLQRGSTADGGGHAASAQTGAMPVMSWQRFSAWRSARMGGRKGAPYATYLAIGAGMWLAWHNGLAG